jgi:NAD(P)-dependent dehydrogenase (short-subunit alcohol dehydrogenase family)
MPIAIVTGGSRGLGKALTRALLDRGWSVVTDGRDPDALERTATELRGPRSGRNPDPPGAPLVTVAGDVTDAGHRRQLVAAARALGGLDLLVNNAGILGPSPQPPLSVYPLDALREVYEVNVVAPLAIIQAALPLLLQSADPRLLDVTSDASVEAYEGWGGYGSAKAAVDQLGAVLGLEEPGLRVWTVDPGDMATRMHQEAFPGQDISDRPAPEEVVGVLVELIESDRPSGRYRADELRFAARVGTEVGR